MWQWHGRIHTSIVNHPIKEFLRFGRSLYDLATDDVGVGFQIRSQRGVSNPQEPTVNDLDADDGQMLRFG